MKPRAFIHYALAPFIMACLGQASGQAVFQAVGSYPGLSGSGTIEYEATSDKPYQISHGAFSSAVGTAFLDNTGGVLDYESENESSAAVAGVVFGTGGLYKLGINQTFNTTGSVGRQPTSGDEMSSFGSSTPTITFGAVYNSTNSAIPGIGVNQLGFVILSRSDYAADVRATVTFSGGGTDSAQRLIGQSAGGEDTFFGFGAPDGEIITKIDLVMEQNGGANHGSPAFMGIDDIGFVTGSISSREPVTYYVSETGVDQDPGSIEKPFRTIQRAADHAMPGDTIIVREGIYRERVAPPRSGLPGNEIVYRGELGSSVVIKGSDLWDPTWVHLSGNVYHAIPDEALFTDDRHVDNKNPFKVAVSSTPFGLNGKPEVDRGYGGDPNLILCIGQVIVDGVLYVQKGYLSEVSSTAQSWFYDRASGSIYINFPDADPASHQVEISTRRRIFAPHLRGLGYIVVEGFVLEHCGNQYPTNFWQTEHPEWQQAGAIGTRSGHHWTIRSNMIRLTHGVGIDFGNEGNRHADLETGLNGEATGAADHIIDSNYITDNGAGGTAAYYPNRITFTNNVVERNNTLLFRGSKRWESAGVKMHGPHNSVISNNLIRDNFGKWGLWLDQGSGNNTKIHGNLIVGNEVGFDLEIGTAYQDKLILDNNVFINNQTGIASREAGGITAMNNLIVNSSGYGVHGTVNNTRTGTWTADHHYYFNNVLVGCALNMSVYPPDYYRSENREFDYNIYQEASGENRFRIISQSYDLAGWKAQWSSYNSSTNADLNSVLNNQLVAIFDPTELTLQLNVNAAYFLSVTATHPMVTADYFGRVIPTDDSASPGPFQNLAQGQNPLVLWRGLKPLDAYASPRFVTMAGVPLHWLRSNGLPIDGSADELDKDADGVMNRLEWLFGTDPNDGGSVFIHEVVPEATSGLELQWQAIPNRSYKVYKSLDLGESSWIEVHGPVEVASKSMLKFTIAVGDPKAFYRIFVSPAN